MPRGSTTGPDGEIRPKRWVRAAGTRAPRMKLVARARAAAALFALALPAGVVPGVSAVAAGEVNVYSYRQEFLIRPLLDRFTDLTGIRVNVVFAKTGMIERLKAEGRHSPADLVLTSDIARLNALVKADLVRPVPSEKLRAAVPLAYRHPGDLWFGLTMRARVIYYAKDRVAAGAIQRYEDLADPKWRGRVCVRSSRHYYNQALLASMIVALGGAKAEAWAKGVRANLARPPQGGDRSQVKAIKEGLCDVAIGNHYYYGVMKFNDERPEQKEWAAAVGLIFPNQGDRGTHVNLSGMAMTKSAPNAEAARRLMEFLAGRRAQAIYASANYEYPVNPAVPWDSEVASWGRFRPDDQSLRRIAETAPEALHVFDRVGFE